MKKTLEEEDADEESDEEDILPCTNKLIHRSTDFKPPLQCVPVRQQTHVTLKVILQSISVSSLDTVRHFSASQRDCNFRSVRTSRPVVGCFAIS